MKNFDWTKINLLGLVFSLCGEHFLSAQSFNLTLNSPEVDRWMYANNASPANNPKSSEFANFSEDTDTRWAQYLLGYDTFSKIPTNLGAVNYLIRRVRLTLTIRLDQAFVYDPTYDSYTTYLPTNDIRYQADSDPGRPIELYGAGFRNGFTTETFVQDTAYGSDAPGQRNAFATGYSTNGLLVDVGNNVGKTNAAFPAVEAYPFAIAQTTNVAPGQLVPINSKFTFDLNLDDPLVRQYVQEALNQGRLRLMVSGLHGSGGQQSTIGFPGFFTHFSAVGDGPVLELEATAVRPVDSDGDGLPDDWEQFYFNSLSQGATDDPDGDGQNNLAEYLAGTNPNDSADKLKITAVHSEANGMFTLQFPFAASRHYVVEYSSNLQNWWSLTNLPLTYYAAPGAAEWRDDGSQTGGLGTNRFYRVRITP
jgi:hypothetical protein